MKTGIRPSNFKDMTGQKFGSWTVLSYSHTDKKAYWVCACTCGKCSVVGGYNLRSGKSRGCHACRMVEVNGRRLGPLNFAYGKKGYRTGIPHTKETRAKMSFSHLKKFLHDPIK